MIDKKNELVKAALLIYEYCQKNKCKTCPFLLGGPDEPDNPYGCECRLDARYERGDLMLVKMITKKYVEPIKNYKFVSAENKKYFISEHPVIYEDMQGRQCCCDISEIKEFPEDRIHRVVGNLCVLTE